MAYKEVPVLRGLRHRFYPGNGHWPGSALRVLRWGAFRYPEPASSVTIPATAARPARLAPMVDEDGP
jgi:hypothetical protein